MSVWAETKDDLRIFYHNNKIVLVLKQQYIKRNKIGKLASEMVNRDLLPRDMWIKDHLVIQQEVSISMGKVIYGKNG